MFEFLCICIPPVFEKSIHFYPSTPFRFSCFSICRNFNIFIKIAHRRWAQQTLRRRGFGRMKFHSSGVLGETPNKRASGLCGSTNIACKRVSAAAEALLARDVWISTTPACEICFCVHGNPACKSCFINFLIFGFRIH